MSQRYTQIDKTIFMKPRYTAQDALPQVIGSPSNAPTAPNMPFGRIPNPWDQNHQPDAERQHQQLASTAPTLETTDKNSDADSQPLDSLERNLPIELSFLIKQQAYCMARMSYLERQIRELREAAATQQVDSPTTPQISSTSVINQNNYLNHHQSYQNQHLHHYHHPTGGTLAAATTSNAAATNQTSANDINTTNRTPATAVASNTVTQIKNGRHYMSDDSGGEYSRATASDDDELSSLLDQIAKSIRPEQQCGNSNITNCTNNFVNNAQLINQFPRQQPQQQGAMNYPAFVSINPNQLDHHHHQAVPIFVMGSPFAVAHPATTSITNNRAQSALRSQQFDQSISAIGQLVSQREKRQIKTQLKTADNWLRMRASSSSVNPLTNHNSSNSVGGAQERRRH